LLVYKINLVRSGLKYNIGKPASALIYGTEQGFDFLGYHFVPEGLAIAHKTLENFVERVIRLYERGPGEPCGSTRLGEYVKRWVRWAEVGFAPAGRVHLCINIT